MTRVYAIYTRDNTVHAFCGSDISEQDKVLVAQNFSGGALSTNTIEVPTPNDELSNLLYPHQVSITNGVATVLTGVDKAAADVKEQARVYLEELRQERNKLLSKTDWWVLPDRVPTAEQSAYRQALRDITDTYASLEDVVWPVKP
jgi:hypothetical protein